MDLSALVESLVADLLTLSALEGTTHPADEPIDMVKLVAKIAERTRTLKIGDLMGTVVVPFQKLETDEDYDAVLDLAHRMLDFFADNALEHERTGEMIERIGLSAFLEGLELDLDVNMISQPRTNSYVRMDGWDDEVQKWNDRKISAAE